MARRKFDFDDYDEDLAKAIRMSDDDLGKLLAGSYRAAEPVHAAAPLSPGDPVEGTVVAVRDNEVVLEIDSKRSAIVERGDFGDHPPAVGQRLAGHFVRHDRERGVLVVGVREARRELFWEELHEGLVLEGRVTEVNRGGLTVDVRGTRAFLPVSHIDRGAVPDPSVYVGQQLEFEVMSFDRAARNLVVSRRLLQDRRRAAVQDEILAGLQEGEERPGRVTRLTVHGAFVDLGGVEGLVHQSRLRSRPAGAAPLVEGQTVRVVVSRVDRTAGRVGLDLATVPIDSWATEAGAFAVGDAITGCVRRVGPEGAMVLLDEGLEGRVPVAQSGGLRPGAVVACVVTAVDAARREILLRPA